MGTEGCRSAQEAPKIAPRTLLEGGQNKNLRTSPGGLQRRKVDRCQGPGGGPPLTSSWEAPGRREIVPSPPGRPRRRDQTRPTGPTGRKDLTDKTFETGRPDRPDFFDFWINFWIILGSKMEPKSTPKWNIFGHPVLQASREQKNQKIINFWSPGKLHFEDLFTS